MTWSYADMMPACYKDMHIANALQSNFSTSTYSAVTPACVTALQATMASSTQPTFIMLIPCAETERAAISRAHREQIV
jgi:hypothetical protein